MQDADNARMKFEDLKAWQKARELTNEIYRLGGLALLNKDFGLRDQLQTSPKVSSAFIARRSCNSGMSRKPRPVR